MNQCHLQYRASDFYSIPYAKAGRVANLDGRKKAFVSRYVDMAVKKQSYQKNQTSKQINK